MVWQFSDMTSLPNFFDVVLFFLSRLVTCPSLVSMSSLVLKLWQFPFMQDWSEVWKSEIPLSEFFPISGDWGKTTKFGTNVSNKMLLNAAKYQGYSFYRFWVIKGKPVFFVSKLLNNPLSSYSLRNFNFFSIAHCTFW